MYQKKLTIFLVFLVILLPLSIWLVPKVPSSTAAKENFWVMKVHNQDVYDMVYLGDSRTYRTLVPQIIDSITGLSSYNLGFNAGGINREMIEVGLNKLNKNGRRILVLGITPSSLLPQNSENNHFHQELNRRSTDLWTRLYVSPHLSPFDPIQPGFLYNAIRGRRIGYYEDFQERGVVLSERVPPDTSFALAVYKNLFENEQVSTMIIDEIRESLCELKDSGIQVIAWRPKGSKSMTLLEDSLSGYHESEIREIVESCGGIWLDTPVPKATYDGSHVPKWVAEDFSRNFALQLKQVLNNTRQQNN